jgi:hypothetical protein
MPTQTPASRQSILEDRFLYFFLRLRKDRIRKTVAAINSSYPEESAEQKARRLIEAQSPLSFLGGAIMHLPELIPGLGQAYELLGMVGGAAAITRMHLYLILEIGLIYGKDIDDKARVPEMMSVVAATGLVAGGSLLAGMFNPFLSIPISGIAATAAARMIGEQAIRLYSSPAEELVPPTPV